jgi:hypothetical protein
MEEFKAVILAESDPFTPHNGTLKRNALRETPYNCPYTERV